MCRLACHAFIGAEPRLAREERGWRLQSTDDPAAWPVRHAWLGWVLLTPEGLWTPTDLRPWDMLTIGTT